MSDSSDSSSPSRVRRRRRRDRRRRSSSVSSSRSPRRSPSRRSSPRPLSSLPPFVGFCLCSVGGTPEPVRPHLWVPQPLCSVSAASELPPRPDPVRPVPVVGSEARTPLCPFLPICRLPQVDFNVLPAAAFCAQAFSLFLSLAFDAMSRIGGLHPLRQLARLTGATGASDPTSSGSGPAGGVAPVAAPDAQPSDGATVTAPAASGGDGSAGPAAAASAPAPAGTAGDGAAAPPAPISKSSGAAFLAPPSGPTPKTPPTKVSAAPPARSSLSSGIDIRDPSYRPSFPKAAAGSGDGDGGGSSSAPAASGSGPQLDPPAPDSVDFSDLVNFSDDAIYSGLADLPVSHLVRFQSLISEVSADQFYAIFNLTQLDIETPTGQLQMAAPPPVRGQYPPDHRSNLGASLRGRVSPTPPGQTPCTVPWTPMPPPALPRPAHPLSRTPRPSRPAPRLSTATRPAMTRIRSSTRTPSSLPAGPPPARGAGPRAGEDYAYTSPPLRARSSVPTHGLIRRYFVSKSVICRPGCPARLRPRPSSISPSVAIAPTTVRPGAHAA